MVGTPIALAQVGRSTGAKAMREHSLYLLNNNSLSDPRDILTRRELGNLLDDIERDDDLLDGSLELDLDDPAQWDDAA